jgi:hypothetical protein
LVGNSFDQDEPDVDLTAQLQVLSAVPTPASTSRFLFLIFDRPELAGACFIERTLNQEPDFSILHFVCQRERFLRGRGWLSESA